METKKEYRNEELEKVVNISKEAGFKVYTFESTSKYINQVFIENQEGKICTVSEKYSGVTYATVHRPNRECGTGFGLTNDIDMASLEMIVLSMNTNSPQWATKNQREAVIKYSNWADYLKKDSILRYYEL